MPTDPAQRHWLESEIGRRQSAIADAEFDIGHQVSGLLRSGRARPSGPELDAHLHRIATAERTIADLQQQAYAIDAEAAAEAAAAAAIDPTTRCPACRAGVGPHHRYCPACGQRLVRAPDPAVPAQQNAAAGCPRCGRQREPEISYCTGCGWRVDRSRVAWYRTRWLRILVIGFILYVFCQAMLPHTDYAGALIVGELIIGAALVPVAFVAYFYERATSDQTPLSVLITTFVAGALLGCAAAVILERAFTMDGNWQYLPVGFIEEGCKFGIVACWLRRRDLYRPDRGVVIGAATGMGFAALETMQYGFNALLAALLHGGGTGSLDALSATLNVRGLLAPLGHGTWTGILAAVVWFERSAGRSPFGRRVWISYVAVSLLHAVYDITISSHSGLISLFSGAQVSIWGILFGLLGFVVLMMIVRVTRRGGDPISQFFTAAHRLGQNLNAGAQQSSQQSHWPPPGGAPFPMGPPGAPAYLPPPAGAPYPVAAPYRAGTPAHPPPAGPVPGAAPPNAAPPAGSTPEGQWSGTAGGAP